MSASDGKIFAEYKGRENLTEICRKLWNEQKKSWALLSTAIGDLSKVMVKKIAPDGKSVLVQLNPRRQKNSAAKTDKISLQKRACFLCKKNLPEEQKAIRYLNRYLILANPAPVFNPHYTVASIRHKKQLLSGGAFADLLFLASDLGGKFAVSYNGPECGASAPDHFHFQIIPAGVLPAEKLVPRKTKGADLRITLDSNAGRAIIIVQSSSNKDLQSWWRSFYARAKKILPGDSEPMLNVICLYRHRKWHLLLFPRRAHRPRQFYRKGENNLLVSPGAIDMGGVIITALKKDFDRLDGKLVEDIYRQVSVDEGIISDLFM